jgi:hypothetical protein
MTKYSKYSKRLHFVTLLCFLLPFFYTGCGKEEVEAEMSVQDTIKTVQPLESDTVLQDSLVINSIDTSVASKSVQTDTASRSEPKKEASPSERISNKIPFLKPILTPSPDIFSGIATVIDTIPFVIYFATFLSFIFLIVGFVVKYIDKKASKTIVLLDTLALVSLIISRSSSWNCSKLWGLWICVTLISILTIFDFYIVKQVMRLDRDDEERKGSR